VELPPDPITNNRKQKRVTVSGTKRGAEKRLTELLRELDTGSFINLDRVYVAEYLRNWLCGYVWPNLAPKTAQNYGHTVEKHLIPGLENVLASQLRAEHIQSFLGVKLSNGLSQRTVRHHYVTRHTALSHAVRQGILRVNPCGAVIPLKIQRREPRLSGYVTVATGSLSRPA
jgi:hypothetical protein